MKHNLFEHQYHKIGTDTVIGWYTVVEPLREKCESSSPVAW